MFIYHRNKRFFFYLFLFLQFPSAYASGRKNIQTELPEMVTGVQYFVTTSDLTIDSVQNLPDSLFKDFSTYNIPSNESLWLKLTLENRLATNKDYIIHFFGHLDNVTLFQKIKDEWITAKSGILVPEKDKAMKGFIKDKIPFSISEGTNTILYIRIENGIDKYLETSGIRIIDASTFGHINIQTRQIQSFFLGVVAILFFFNLLLYLFSGTHIYLYYMLYAFFSSLYFIHFFQYFESGYFVNHPKISIYFFFTSTFIPLIYSWFLHESLKRDIEEKVLLRLKKYALAVTFSAFIILVIALIDFTSGVLVNDIFSILNSIAIVLIVIFLYRKVSNTVRIILTGSLFLVTGAFSTILFNFKNEVPVHVYFFQAGVFIELIFFTVAINFMHQKERLEKFRYELRNTRLENQKLIKEREAEKLRAQIELKERDLANKAVIISQKETLIKNVSSQLEKQVHKNVVKINDIKNVVSDLNSKTSNNFWDDFETHFVNVHPEFYKLLNSKYPGLTTNERRLCAFIKLNLTTKEIASITKRNPESIHMTRSRLRKKMGLDKTDNLENIITSIT